MTETAIFPDLKGASVFITGGGSGIGAALTDGFLAQGANVGFVQRSDASGFAAEMGEKHGRAPLFIQCDVTDTAALKAAIDQTAEAFGPVSVLVNNAANDKRHDTLDVDEAFWDWMIAINLKAYFFGMQAVIPGMQKLGGGAIINFSSISYKMGQAGYPIYAASNAAIANLSHTMAREFGHDKIRINALAPGWVLTQKQKDMWATPEALEGHLGLQCLKEHLYEEDVVGTTLFLASKVSRMITGQVICVDGGVVQTG